MCNFEGGLGGSFAHVVTAYKKNKAMRGELEEKFWPS